MLQKSIEDLMNKLMRKTQEVTSISSSSQDVVTQSANALDLACENQISEEQAEMHDRVVRFVMDTLAEREMDVSAEKLQNCRILLW